ncbi:MAG: hypothetical protein JWM53_2279 [bacterium]|jgi:hypothetical protein|nr:hypothetical protein [bacterium]
MLPAVRVSASRDLSEVLLPVAVAVTILLFAFGSTDMWQFDRVGSRGRWIALLLLGLLAVVAAARERTARLHAHHAFAAGFVLLAAVSTTWAVRPHVSAGRAASLAVLVVTVVGLAAWAAERPRRALFLFAGVLAGAVAVVLASYGLWVVDSAHATQSSTAGSPWRFRGIGGNPNTVAMLVAVALPAAVVAVVVTRRALVRGVAATSVGLLALELALSGSRGGIVAAVLGSAIAVGVGLTGSRVRRGGAAAGVAVALLVFAGVVAKLVPAASSRPAEVTAPAPPAWLPWYSEVVPTGYALVQATDSSGNPRQAILLPKSLGVCKQEDELGRPQPGQQATFRRTLFTSSGRVEAWIRALHEGSARLLAGYGFGSEDAVFFNCFYFFTGAHVENSYLGLFLQLGAVGVVLFAALAIALGRGMARAAYDPETRVAAAIAAGGGAAALVLAFVQSYFYSVGNIATLSVWLFAFVGAALGLRRGAHAA